MSKPAGMVLVLAALALTVEAAAQNAATLQVRLARAQAQADSIDRVRAAESAALRSQAQVGSHAGLVLVLPSGGRPGSAAVVARLADSLMRDLGAFDAASFSGYVLVAQGLANVSRSDELLAGREEVRFVTWTSELSGRGERATAENAAWELSRALATKTAWRRWLDYSLPVIWDTRRDNSPIVDAMIEEHWSRGRGCLAGSSQDCVAYLGLDDSPDSLRHRFTAADLRTEYGQPHWYWGNETAPRACQEGDDEACYRMAAQRFRYSSAIPASPSARRSLMFFVRSTYGPEVLKALLMDTVGTEAQRLSRATGKPAVETAASWRDWLLVSAGRTPVHAGLKESLATLLAVAVLLTLATRSGRWRA